MADFISKNTHETDEPTIEVTIDPEKPLPVGRHLFQLVVVDGSNNESEPDQVEVIIVDTQNPTAVLQAIPAKPEFGQSFTLSGRNSRDLPPGRIVKYIWTMVS